MTNEIAVYLKLMLQSGMEQVYFSRIQELLGDGRDLVGLERSLYRFRKDAKRSIAILIRNTNIKRVDYDAVLALLVEELRKQYVTGGMTQSAVVSAMHYAARQTTKYTYEPWATMDQMSDWYCYAMEEKMPKEAFDAALYAFLTEKTTLSEIFAHNSNQKATFRDLMAYEKRGMNRIRFIVNNRIVPAYFASLILIIAIIAIIMSIDEVRFEGVTVGLLAIFGLMSIALLISVPIVRNKEIDLELARYDFTILPEHYKNVYEFFVDGQKIRFDEVGVIVDEDSFAYQNLKGELSTSGRLMRVHLGFEFFTEFDRYLEIPFCPESLAMIERFQIKLENASDLEYLLKNKRQAFLDIYTYSIVRPDLHRNRKS